MKEEKFYFSALMLCSAIVIVYIVQVFVPGFTENFLLDSSAIASRPWILVTSIFLHGSSAHLLSNLFALGMFGLLAEKATGTRKFLAVFFFTGLVANIAAAFFYSSSLGASGAIFGVMGVLAALRPRMVVWSYGVPMPMFIAAIFWFLLDLAGVFYPSSTANLAHIAGLATGIAIGMLMRPRQKTDKKKEEKSLDDREFDEWEKGHMQGNQAWNMPK